MAPWSFETLLRVYKSSISARLLSAILMVSSLVSVFTTAGQLAFDYHQDLDSLEKNLALIQQSHSETLAGSIWNMDDAQLSIELQGILQIPGVRYVEISDGKNTLADKGTVPTGRTLVRQFPLVYKDAGNIKPIGRATVIADLDGILARLWKKLALIFFSQLLKTLIVSTLIFVTIRQLLTRHLIAITDYLRILDFKMANQDMSLKRRPSAIPDELDVLVSVVNQMRSDLYRSYEEAQTFNQQLEKKVQERTMQLVESQAVISTQQQSLISAAKLSALGEMAGGVAHEINSPLAIIKTVSEQLGEVVQEEPLQRGLVVEMTGILARTTDRIAKIVQGLRSFSRDGSRDVFNPTPVKELLDDTLSFCRERFKNTGIQLEVHLPEEPLVVDCRATEMSQVLLNLLNNSRDAIENRKERWVRISARKSGDQVEIRITDSGAAIPQETQKKMFQPFFTTKDVGKGTGLGLSISLGIVKSHGGELALDNQEANTTFVLKLPLLKSKPAAKVA